MKTIKLIGLLIALFSITTLISCEDEDVNGVGRPMDISPIKFCFYLLDEDSTNLLNDSINRELFKEKVKVIYKNREYKCTEVIDSLYYSNLWNSEESRALLVRFNGLRIEQTIPASSKYPYMFTFGDFDATKDHSEISFIIDWGDGTSDKIYYKYDFKIHKGHNAMWHYEFYINDELKSKGNGDVTGTNYKFIK